MMNAYERLLIKKERTRNLILLKEYEIKDQVRGLSESMTPESLKHQAFQFMMNRPDLVIKAGYGIYKLVRQLQRK